MLVKASKIMPILIKNKDSRIDIVLMQPVFYTEVVALSNTLDAT